jgi:hypothetical protein
VTKRQEAVQINQKETFICQAYHSFFKLCMDKPKKSGDVGIIKSKTNYYACIAGDEITG